MDGKTPMEIGLLALAQIIRNVNPYTGVKDDTAGTETAEMAIGDPFAHSLQESIRSIRVELERNYETTWRFKGQAQNVKAAIRVPYTFEVKNTSGETLWQQTEHLLIGFAGGDSGG